MARVRALRSDTYPHAEAALASGEISGGHLDELTRFHDRLSEAVSPDAWTEADPALVDAARAVDPAALRRFLDRQIAPRLDPDGCQPKEKDLAEPANRLALDWRANGWLHLDGDLDPETATLFAAQIDARTPPPPPAEEGPTPFRSADQRRGQGLAEWVNLGRDDTSDVIDGGERPQLTVTIGLDARSRPLDIGRATRIIPAHIRRAVADRDKGSTFPGCARPPTHRQAHHVMEWRDGGATATENLALLCGRHHRILHHTDWEVRMNQGRPEFLPPAYVDPQKRPRTNAVHQPP
jgi:hypothetical protein